MTELKLLDLGLVDYGECWDFQRRIFEGVIARKTGATGGQSVPARVEPTPSRGSSSLLEWPRREGGRQAERSQPAQRLAGRSAQPVKAEGVPSLILCEHPHVYTLGRSGKAGNMLVDETFLKKIGATFHRIDRGGDITYHGPGQLVAYPILDLDALRTGVRSYIEALEQAVIDTLAELGIAAGRRTGAAGVWLGTENAGSAGNAEPLRKICAIGVRASRGVTMHGLALNVNTRLEYFSHINPCGFAPDAVTSVERETGHATDMAQVKKLFVEHFERVFGVRVQ